MNKTPQNVHLSRTVHSVVHSELRPFWKQIVHSEVWARVPFKFVRRTKDILNGFLFGFPTRFSSSNYVLKQIYTTEVRGNLAPFCSAGE